MRLSAVLLMSFKEMGEGESHGSNAGSNTLFDRSGDKKFSFIIFTNSVHKYDRSQGFLVGSSSLRR